MDGVNFFKLRLTKMYVLVGSMGELTMFFDSVKLSEIFFNRVSSDVNRIN